VSHRIERIGDAELHLADCRDVLPTLGRVDAVVTDPPYGVGFTGKNTKHTTRNDDGYSGSDDSAIGPALMPMILGIASRALVFSGIRLMHDYPRPDDVGGVFCPAGAGIGRWGWVGFHPALMYGRRPSGALFPTCITSFDITERNGHPCPKPDRWMSWAVTVASSDHETVLDPFMGSGTTGVACARLGRRFIGVEIHEPYFDIACRRIEQAYRQADLFVPAPRKPDVTPRDLFAEVAE
jgi:hypothetical protein